MEKPDRRGVAPSLEAEVATEVKALVTGIPVGAEFTVEPTAKLLSALEFFIPHVLRSSHPGWEWESLDGFYVARARKTGRSSIQLAGTCILITDQTMTPFLVELASSPSGESVDSFRVSVGEPGRGKLGISGPRWNSHEADTLLALLTTRLDDIAWSYTIVSDEG